MFEKGHLGAHYCAAHNIELAIREVMPFLGNQAARVNEIAVELKQFTEKQNVVDKSDGVTVPFVGASEPVLESGLTIRAAELAAIILSLIASPEGLRPISGNADRSGDDVSGTDSLVAAASARGAVLPLVKVPTRPYASAVLQAKNS